jgi:hypothetical protein
MKLPFTLRDQAAQGNFDKIAAALGEQTFKAALPFAAGWANYGGIWETGSYSRIGRLVVLHGLVTKTGGTPTLGDAIATLPAGARPTLRLRFTTVTGNPDQTRGTVDVAPTGIVSWEAGATAETDYTSLSGIVFVAA